MTQIEPFKFLLNTVRYIDIQIKPFKLGQPIDLIVILCSEFNTPIMNHDGGKIGVPLTLPCEVAQEWGSDDTVVETWVLQTMGFTAV